MTSPADLFRSLHAAGEFIVLPNAWDCASAGLFVQNGAKAIATTSSGIAWAAGFPDGERIPLVQLIDVVARIARTVSVPVSVDFERGYGETPTQVAESVTRVIDAGAVAINLEDATRPASELAERIVAARRAGERAGVHLFINARTDIALFRAVAPERYVEESLARAKVFEDAGADGFFVPGDLEPAHIEGIAKGTRLPLNVLAQPGVPPVAELRRLGARRLSVGGRLAEVALEGARRACIELLEAGTYSSFFPEGVTYPKMNKLF